VKKPLSEYVLLGGERGRDERGCLSPPGNEIARAYLGCSLRFQREKRFGKMANL
jgi:hypothetical protein